MKGEGEEEEDTFLQIDPIITCPRWSFGRSMKETCSYPHEARKSRSWGRSRLHTVITLLQVGECPANRNVLGYLPILARLVFLVDVTKQS